MARKPRSPSRRRSSEGEQFRKAMEAGPRIIPMTDKAILSAKESHRGEPCSFCGKPGAASVAMPVRRKEAEQLGLPHFGLIVVRACRATAIAMSNPQDCTRTYLDAIGLVEDGKVPVFAFQTDNGEEPPKAMLINFD